MVSNLFLSFLFNTKENKLLNLRTDIVICCAIFFLVEILYYIAKHLFLSSRIHFLKDQTNELILCLN